MSTLQVTNANGRSFTIRIVREGDKYGRNLGVVHDRAMPLIEVYDRTATDPTFGPHGQFVSRYFADDFMAHTGGLALDGGVPVWALDAGALAAAQGFVLSSARSPS